jgi:hypothetical protein
MEMFIIYPHKNRNYLDEETLVGESNIIIEFLNIIHRPVLILKHNVSETGFRFRCLSEHPLAIYVVFGLYIPYCAGSHVRR